MPSIKPANSTPSTSYSQPRNLIRPVMGLCYTYAMFSFSLQNVLIGLVMTMLGALMVKYTFWLVNTTGPQDWIERYTGGGSTYGIYKIFGVILAIIGLMIATGLGNNVMEFLFSPLKSLFAPTA